MNQHAAPTGVTSGPQIPEPTYAERARTLVYLGRIGTLSTLSAKHPGYPFGSVMPYSLDPNGSPLFLISTMAMHTQNLLGNRKASLLVTQAGGEGDPLATGRVTLLGEVRVLTENELGRAREIYLTQHKNASYWVDFDDFAFYRLEVEHVYFVGGFAAMDWIDAKAYLAASPDPLADVAMRIIEHMNRDHADSLVILTQVYAKAEADEAVMVGVDRLGFKVRIKHGGRLHAARIAFPSEVKTAEEARIVLVEMVRKARLTGASSSSQA